MGQHPVQLKHYTATETARENTILPGRGTPGPVGSTMTEGTQSRKEGVSSTGNPERKPKLLSCKTDLRVGSWNVRTLWRDGRLKQLCDNAERYHLDIVGVQEARYCGKDKTREGQWEFIYSGREDGRHEEGVGLLMSRRAAGALRATDCVSERIMRARFSAGVTNLTVIVAYAPTEVSSTKEKDDFYIQLDNILGQVPRHDLCLLLGDFNARVGRDVEAYPGVIGPHGMEELNDNGQRLLDTCCTQGLTIGGTLFQHKDIHKYTWTSNTATRPRVQIDHIAISSRWKRSMRDCRTYRGADIYSDHELLVATIKMRLARPKRAGKRGQFAIHKLKVTETRESFQQEIARNIAEPAAENVEDRWNHIKEGLTKAAESVLGKGKKKPTEWISVKTEELVERRRAAKVKRDSVYTRSSAEEYRQLDREVKRSAKKDKQDWYDNCAKELEEASGKRDQRKVYQVVKTMTGKSTPQPLSVKDKDGRILTEQDEVEDRWKEHFQELLNRPPPLRRYHQNPQSWDELDVETGAPTLEEVRQAIKKLKDHKAPGTDGIKAELLKAGGDAVLEALHTLIVKIWEEEKVPQDWKRSEIKVLFKKGDRKECKNYRGISLLCVAGKAFAWIVLRRMQKEIDQRLRENQAGFRSGRGCTDQIFSLRILIERCLEFQIPAVATFVDFKAAFDSVHRPSLWKIMREYGIPEKVVSIIRCTYSGSEARVMVGESTTDWFEVETGVRQGCVWSPLLFGLLIDWVLKKSCEGHGLRMRKRVRTLKGVVEGWSLADLDFADDVTLVEGGGRESSAALTRLRKAGEEVGLVVSKEKTKAMPIGEVQATVKDDSQNIEVVSKFCYLGSTVTSLNSLDQEISIRIGKAGTAFRLLDRVWKAKIKMQTKMKIYNAVVVTTLLYGSETWSTTRKQDDRLDAFDTRCLRIILKIRWWHYRRNSDIREITQQPYISTFLKKHRLRWYGHMLRMENTRLPNRLYHWDPTAIGGKRRPGRQRQRWQDACSRDLTSIGLTIQDAESAALNREEWRTTIAALV